MAICTPGNNNTLVGSIFSIAMSLEVWRLVLFDFLGLKRNERAMGLFVFHLFTVERERPIAGKCLIKACRSWFMDVDIHVVLSKQLKRYPTRFA